VIWKSNDNCPTQITQTQTYFSLSSRLKNSSLLATPTCNTIKNSNTNLESIRMIKLSVVSMVAENISYDTISAMLPALAATGQNNSAIFLEPLCADSYGPV
jgi:hypothetical protein